MTTEKETFESIYNSLEDIKEFPKIKKLKQLHDKEMLNKVKECTQILINEQEKLLKEKDKEIAELKQKINEQDIILSDYENKMNKYKDNYQRDLNEHVRKDGLIKQLNNEIMGLTNKLDIFEKFPKYEKLLKESEQEIMDLKEEIKYLENTDKGKLMVEIKNLLNIQNLNLGQLNKRREEIYKLQNEVKQLKEYIEGNK